MKRFVSLSMIVPIVLFSNWMRADEKAKPVPSQKLQKKVKKPAEAYDLIAVASATSLLDVSAKCSKILEELSPGSSMMLALGLSAMAMKPEFRNIDFKKTVQFLAYRTGSKTHPVVWALVLKLKEEKQPIPKIKDKHKLGLHMKEVGQNVILADTQALVDHVSDIPDFALPDKSDLSIEIYPSKYATFYKILLKEYQDYLIKQVMKSNAQNRDTLNYIKLIQLKIDYLEYVLAQCRKVNIDVTLTSDSVGVKSALTPETASAFAGFLAKQPENGKSRIVLNYTKDTIVGSGNLVLTDVLNSNLIDFIKEIYIETAKQAESLDFLETISVILNKSSGHFSIFIQNEPKDYKFYGLTTLDAKQHQAVADYFSSHCRTSGNKKDPVFYQLIDHNDCVLCTINKNQLEIFSNLSDVTKTESFLASAKQQLAQTDPKTIWLKTSTVLIPGRLDFDLSLDVPEMKRVFYRPPPKGKTRKRVRIKF